MTSVFWDAHRVIQTERSVRRAIFIYNPINSQSFVRIISNYQENFLDYKQCALSVYIFWDTTLQWKNLVLISSSKSKL